MDSTAPTLPFYTDQTDFQGKISIWDFREKKTGEGEFPILVFFDFLIVNQNKKKTNTFSELEIIDNE